MVWGVIIYVDSYLYTARVMHRVAYVGVGGCLFYDLKKRLAIQ